MLKKLSENWQQYFDTLLFSTRITKYDKPINNFEDWYIYYDIKSFNTFCKSRTLFWILPVDKIIWQWNVWLDSSGWTQSVIVLYTANYSWIWRYGGLQAMNGILNQIWEIPKSLVSKLLSMWCSHVRVNGYTTYFMKALCFTSKYALLWLIRLI